METERNDLFEEEMSMNGAKMKSTTLIMMSWKTQRDSYAFNQASGKRQAGSCLKENTHSNETSVKTMKT